MNRVVDICNAYQIPVHLDGARLFNAAIALDVAVPQLTKGFASVTVCLSKGLGAPMGSLLCGDEHLVQRAKKARKLLGGSLRQVGIVAAAGLEALSTYAELLAEDHRHSHPAPRRRSESGNALQRTRQMQGKTWRRRIVTRGRREAPPSFTVPSRPRISRRLAGLGASSA